MSAIVIKPGQVWEQYSPNAAPRTLHVMWLVDLGACGGTERGACCHVVETGHMATIAVRRMKPGKTRGYRMVADANQ